MRAKISHANEWVCASVAVLLMAGAAVAYAESAVSVDSEDALLAAVGLGAAGHVSLAHVQRRLVGMPVPVVISLALVGIVAGIAAVMTAALASEETKVLGLALAGVAGAVAGAETLTRLAQRSLEEVSVGEIKRTSSELQLTGQGLAKVEGVRIGSHWAERIGGEGDSLTVGLPEGVGSGELVRIGSGPGAAEFPLPPASA